MTSGHIQGAIEYVYAAYAAGWTIYAAYGLSLWWRLKNSKKAEGKNS